LLTALPPVSKPPFGEIDRSWRRNLRFLREDLQGQENLVIPPLGGKEDAITDIPSVGPSFVDLATEVPRSRKSIEPYFFHRGSNLNEVVIGNGSQEVINWALT
jgi:hypothetical protein